MFRKITCFFTFIAISVTVYAQNSGQTLLDDHQMRVILDPKIGERCNELIEKRGQKLGVKNQLRALKQRNLYLQKITPKNKRKALGKLALNLKSIERELGLNSMKISHLEETIIRRGCPGIDIQSQ